MTTVLKMTLMFAEMIIAVLLITVVVLQESKTAGMGSSIGGAADTFFGGKARGKDAILSRLTVILGIIFALTTLALVKYLNTY